MEQTIVFLDIDGVARPDTKPNNYELNTECMKAICELLNAINAKVVISSNWRLAFSLEFFNDHFDNRVIGFTPELSHLFRPDGLRLKEIAGYINKNIKGTIRYLIIDDQETLFKPNQKGLFLCNPKSGFKKQDVKAACEAMARCKGRSH